MARRGRDAEQLHAVQNGLFAYSAITNFHSKLSFCRGTYFFTSRCCSVCFYYSRLNFTCQAFFKTFLKTFRWTLFALYRPPLRYAISIKAVKPFVNTFLHVLSFAQTTSLFCRSNCTDCTNPFWLYIGIIKSPLFGKNFQIEGLKILHDFTNFGKGKDGMKG